MFSKCCQVFATCKAFHALSFTVFAAYQNATAVMSFDRSLSKAMNAAIYGIRGLSKSPRAVICNISRFARVAHTEI